MRDAAAGLLGWLSFLSIFVLPHHAVAQVNKPHQIGFLTPASAASMADRLARLRKGLRDLGYVEGQNTTLEIRSAEGEQQRLGALADELIRLKVDVILTHGAAATLAAKKASTTTPIVCFACGELVSTGLVSSLARPGTNITGQTLVTPEVSGKRIELLKQVFPSITRLAVLWNSTNTVSKPELKETEIAARVAGLELISASVQTASDFEAAFASMKTEGAQAVIILSDAMFFGNRDRIAGLATEIHLPAISYTGEFARSGTIMSYGPDVLILAQRAATYVDKILKGAKPADLPVEQPTKFELVINLKTANTLGVAVPNVLLIAADEVIE